jgi:hypothetical protein
MTIQEVTRLDVDTVVRVRSKRKLALVKSVGSLTDPKVTVQFQSGIRKLARPDDLEFVRFASNAEGRRCRAVLAQQSTDD